MQLADFSYVLREAVTKKQTKLEIQVSKVIPQILGGSILAIDPSSGSRNSMPGYAVFQEGVLIDSGFIEVARDREFNRKLFLISKSLREDFAVPDILVVEFIPPFMQGMGFSKSIVSLQRAVGAIIGSIDRPLVEVPPVTWHKHTPVGYEKTDEKDAIMLGYTAILTACRLAERPLPLVPSRVYNKDTQEYPDSADKGVGEDL